MEKSGTDIQTERSGVPAICSRRRQILLLGDFNLEARTAETVQRNLRALKSEETHIEPN